MQAVAEVSKTTTLAEYLVASANRFNQLAMVWPQGLIISRTHLFNASMALTGARWRTNCPERALFDANLIMMVSDIPDDECIVLLRTHVKSCPHGLRFRFLSGRRLQLLSPLGPDNRIPRLTLWLNVTRVRPFPE